MAITKLVNLAVAATPLSPGAGAGSLSGKSPPQSGLPQVLSGKIHPLMQRYLTAEDKVFLSEAYEQSKNEPNGEEKAVRLALRYATVRYGETLLAQAPGLAGGGSGAAWTGQQTPAGPMVLKTSVRQALSTLIEWQQSTRQAQVARRYADIAKTR